jgi:hypothetical protein
VLVDGNKEKLARIKGAARTASVEITFVLDLVRVLEYLWRTAYAFHAQGTEEAETWVEARLLALLNGRSVGAIAKRLRSMIKRHAPDAATARPVARREVPRQQLEACCTTTVHSPPVCRSRPA